MKLKKYFSTISKPGLLTLVGVCYLALLSSQSLQLYYPLNGNANDASGNSYHGAVHGATSCTDHHGSSNHAYSFDGVNDYVDCYSLDFMDDIINEFTLQFWMLSSPTGLTTFSDVFGVIDPPSSGMAFVIDAHRTNYSSFISNYFWFYIRDNDGKVFSFTMNASAAFDSSWHCVTFVVDDAYNGQARAYIDGVQHSITINYNQGPQNFSNFQEDFTFGAKNNRGTIQSYFRGGLDQFRIWDYALDSILVDSLCSEVDSIADTLEARMMLPHRNARYSDVEKIKIMPNPVITDFELLTDFIHPFGIEIFNISGYLVYNIARVEDQRVDISHLPKGIYVLKVTEEVTGKTNVLQLRKE